MTTLAINNKKKILQYIRNGEIDAVSISFPTIVDDILLQMNEKGILKAIEDKRRKNKTILISTILALAIAAKMKLKTALTDMPFAINDAELLS